ncbi:MAG TPA: DUF4209 domain-containing protein [Candidatus Marinimicrobia bacterium]|mgnify:CR=1 FL=1|nr:DUF4209 domain-containing protein [Candidatus Neomarinimicrobiota bacterium]HRS50921.1 DUF4209 domain-containing protein [Candidatus Neomarinimicrobiota bacterium]HRU91737.1 DUF4209 domain-containing protein [Candidatus Neomarinimicrobiota bacterium]
MENFTDLKSLYNHLEKNAVDYKYPHQIGSLFQKLRDLKHNENKSDEAEKSQWEIDFFNFMIEEGKLKPMFTGTNDKGEVIEYPTLDSFDDRTYEYLFRRLDSTSNSLLKARYSHILWCSPKKHAKYAKMAVDSYLELIKIYETKDMEVPQKNYELDVLEAIKNAYSIACQAQYEVDIIKVDIIKSELRRLVTRFNFKSSSSFALRANLIELMLKDKRRFLKEDFLGFENICWQISESLTESGNIHGAIDMLELGEKVDQKLGKKTYDWRRRIAESYETLMKQAEKGNNLASLTFCKHALENYKKLKDEDKINELEKKYTELKNSMKLAEFKIVIDSTEHIKRCREVAQKVVKNDPDEIIKLLMFNENLLPRYKDMEKIAQEHSKKFIAQHLFPIEILDQSGHPAQHFSDEDEKKYYGILQQYDWELRLNKIHLINEIFFAAIRENKLSSDILLRFLNRHFWFGKNISKILANQTIKYNWLNLIAPSLHEYFLQIQYYFANPNYPPNLVLSIDSLTLKIEGLIRDICQFSGVTTFYMTNDNKGRNIVREKDIHALLYEEPIKELFDEDDLLFWKFLLVEKAGYNLRHKVAHSLMLFQEYSINYMHLLILALLRLGKYNFVKKEDATSHNSR